MDKNLVNVADVEEDNSDDAVPEDVKDNAPAEIDDEVGGDEKLLAGKYKTPEELEKGYKELSKKMRELKPEVPDTYSLDAVKDYVGEQQDPVLEEFLSEFKEVGLSQEQADRLLTKYYEKMQGDMPNPEEELAKLGSEASNIIGDIRNFFAKNKANFTDAELQSIEGALVSADAVRGLHKVIASTRSQNIPAEAVSGVEKSPQEYLDAAFSLVGSDGRVPPSKEKQYQEYMDKYALAVNRNR